MLTGLVSVIFPPKTYNRRDVTCNCIRSFIVEDIFERSQKNPDAFRYKVTAWGDQARNLTVEINKIYRFENFKVKPKRGLGIFLGQHDYDVHLSIDSTISELSLENKLC